MNELKILLKRCIMIIVTESILRLAQPVRCIQLELEPSLPRNELKCLFLCKLYSVVSSKIIILNAKILHTGLILNFHICISTKYILNSRFKYSIFNVCLMKIQEFSLFNGYVRVLQFPSEKLLHFDTAK